MTSGDPGVEADTAVQVVVLAGGAGQRMGQDKRRLVLNGRTLLERTVDTAATLRLPIWVAGGATPPEDLNDWPSRTGARSCTDGIGDGPAAGILGAAARLADSPDTASSGLLALACDLPQMSSELLRAIVRVAAAHKADLVAPVTVQQSRTRLHPLTAFYSARALQLLHAHVASGDLSLTSFIEKQAATSPSPLLVCTFSAHDLGFAPERLEHDLLNCNTDQDWLRVQRRAAEAQRRD